ISGQTNSALSLPSVSATDAGIYSVVVSGACSVPVTNSATLFVNANTIISKPPTNTTNCPGTTANFSVNATGTGLSYQWYHGAGPLSGKTNSTLSLLNVSAPADLGSYSVVVSGVCGLPVTNSATLLINSNTIVATPPKDVTVCPGMTANFTVSAIGTDFTFQWYNSAGPLSGQTSSTLSLTNVSAANAGIYRVVVSGICGVPITNSATLAVNTNALIATSLSNTTNCPGTTANFSVNAAGTGLTYQWYKGAALLAGHTTNVLTLGNVSSTDAGVYSVVVSGVCGLPVTNSATLVVNTNALIVKPMSNATNCPGTIANFSVNAVGTGLTYQWYKGAALLAGHTTNVLTLNNVIAADAGTYSVVVSGVCSATATNSATLFVNENIIVVYGASTNETVCPGATVNFFEFVTGTDLRYQWYKGTTLLAGQTTNLLTLTNVGVSDAATYNLVISGACGVPVTNRATLFVNATTIVAVPPTNTTVCPGTTANFSVNATGTGLTYQWYNATGGLAGQTGSTLSLPNVRAADAGVYTVVVSGACGAPVTLSAVLTVNQNVSVAALANVTNNIGTSVTFTALASGTGPFNYQWFKAGTALAGQTNRTLTLSNLQPGDSGMYSVSVTGACGQAAATAAVLTVNLPPVATITYPTNGTIFVEPATFTVLASASDPDGVVTNVEFFSSTNGTTFVLIGQTNNQPYLTIASNLPAGHYTFVARATDNWGATGDSAPVSVDVVPVNPPDVFTVGAITLNTQDGFQWLTNVACNPVYSHANALRIDIHNITNSAIRVMNASGTNNGVPFVISPGAIQPGTCWTNVIKFYDPLNVAFFPVLTVQLADPIGVGEPDGNPQAIFSGKFLRDGTFLVEFTTVPGITYYVQYSSDMVHWKTVFPPFAGTGQHLQWIDSGPPETESLPSIKTVRFYRVLLAN
ncbi:MAG TPA: Ig-like domain-containing protein, partial [Verrucomicrobiae bacterium]|nr:Ig-like domain-containing protein [Verrucomicrobiae bacterium]